MTIEEHKAQTEAWIRQQEWEKQLKAAEQAVIEAAITYTEVGAGFSSTLYFTITALLALREQQP